MSAIVDDTDLPKDEREFGARLEALGSDYEIQYYVKKAEWVRNTLQRFNVLVPGSLGDTQVDQRRL